MKRPLFILVVALVMSCSDDDKPTSSSPKEEQAITLANAKCGSKSNMPWLRDIIRQSEADVKFRGNIYAISYSGGVAIMHQPWISSCMGCLVYDCDGKKLVLGNTSMQEVIAGMSDDSLIFSPT